MHKKLLFFLILILGCQQTWNESEKNDFQAKCKRQEIFKSNIDTKERDNFCDCLLNNSVKLGLSYPEFLKKDFNERNDEGIFFDQILNGCVD
tara:strand:+ start:2007 stop:2282 length:276 start_codon:yes stop_codon:yes gene_type:complete